MRPSLPFGRNRILFCAALSLALSVPGCRRSRRPAPQAGGPAVVMVEPGEDGVSGANEREPNDTRAQAQPLEVGQAVTGALAARTGTLASRTGSADEDWYALQVPPSSPRPSTQPAPGETIRPSILSLTLGDCSADVRLEAFDRSGKRLVRVDNGGQGEGETLVNLALGHLASAAGAVYVRVSTKGPLQQASPYRLISRLRPSEAGEELEPNYKKGLASDLAIGKEATGYFGWHHDTDWFRVALDPALARGLLRVELDGVDGVWPHLSVRDHRGRLLQRRLGQPGEMVVLDNIQAPPGGDAIYLVVESGKTFNVETGYSLRVATTGATGSEVEPNDKPRQATRLALGQSLSGTLADHYDRDCFEVPVPREGLLRVAVTPPWRLDPLIEVLDAKGAVGYSSNTSGEGKEELLVGLYVRPPLANVCVRAARSGAADSAGRYRIMVKLESAERFEREPNGRVEDATTIPAGASAMRGYMYPKGDVDTFRLSGLEGTIAVKAEPPEGVRVALSLFDGTGRKALVRGAATKDGTVTMRAMIERTSSYIVQLVAKDGQNGVQPYRLVIGTQQVSPVAPVGPLP